MTDTHRSPNNCLTDVSLHSYHLSSWYCMDIVRGSSVLVMGVKGLSSYKFKIVTLLNSIYTLLPLYLHSNSGKNCSD